ncbi:MAG: class I SAM-dependent rRNA methyltransferase, partial [Sphaerochaeta sp.]
PPKLAQTKAQADSAAKAYKDLNRLAMQKIKNGGIIATFSCSGAISSEMLRTILAWSAKDAKVEIQILKILGQSEDHPIRISFPESEYLNGYILRVIR